MMTIEDNIKEVQRLIDEEVLSEEELRSARIVDKSSLQDDPTPRDRNQVEPAYGQRVLAFSSRYNDWYIAYYLQSDGNLSNRSGVFEEDPINRSSLSFDTHVTHWLPLPDNPRP